MEMESHTIKILDEYSHDITELDISKKIYKRIIKFI